MSEDLDVLTDTDREDLIAEIERLRKQRAELREYCRMKDEQLVRARGIIIKRGLAIHERDEALKAARAERHAMKYETYQLHKRLEKRDGRTEEVNLVPRSTGTEQPATATSVPPVRL